MTERRFTGRHMFAILIAMFGTIIAVNLVMAHFAVSTFGGTVVDNSYVATRDYNRWLAQARAQEKLGWRMEASLDPERRMRITAVAPDGPIDGVVSAVARHPLGQAPDRTIAFEPVGAGRYVATDRLSTGRWTLKIMIESRGQIARFTEDIKG